MQAQAGMVTGVKPHRAWAAPLAARIWCGSSACTPAPGTRCRPSRCAATQSLMWPGAWKGPPAA